ncbi:hypothetical protein EKPJFOCH_0663 [Methylobacterium thuringiense]|uniref:Toxin-activating lysine-acyltransferase n=2 Tax=Methylobacterium thuringiense TaxID=1003091 RepID=A0ABQ4TFM8_9HYPH|nr:hypothetical protein EKPJFOCH_0663 [Methylobacterium thuringiense]
MADAAISSDLKLVQLPDANTAVGLAVRFMSGRTAYAELPFGSWSSAICNQVGRGHYAFVTDNTDKVVGYAGWAMTPEAKAEAWADQGVELSDAECREGDCLIMNTWIADTPAVHRFLVDAVRAGARDKKTIYFRRVYDDGRRRVVRIAVNEFVTGHLERNVEAALSAATQDAPLYNH